ncbi:hypothetical protein CALVIDRAFT_533058 [Calocera viscosa TUFC12733]|uniref:Uncharacterized protein n=1 Tax=Calocera viscosa (strain TUFC12733) TaxID=1330018 RepID=A0A167RAL6_CALVF|nr:hypothetical protein CALVIDRAFT_533058 [Calocera viscosa TUFC12733]
MSASAYAPSPLRVLFLSPSSAPTPSFSICDAASLSCGPAVSPPVTALGGGQWAADVSLPSPASGQDSSAQGQSQGQWVLRMQTDQGAVFSSPFSVGSSAQPDAAGSAQATQAAPTAQPSAQTQLQALQTLVLTGTPSPSNTLSATSTGNPTASCTSSPCPTASPAAALGVSSGVALALALSLCLPIVLAMCLFLLHFCRRRRRHVDAQPHEDCIFPPSPPLRAIERLEQLSRPLPPLVSVCELTPAELERHELEQELEARDLEKHDLGLGEKEKEKEKALPPPPPAYEGIQRKRVPDFDIDVEKALRALGRAISDSALVRLGSFRARPGVPQAQSEPAVPGLAVREVVRKPPPVLAGKRVSFSIPPAQQAPSYRSQPSYTYEPEAESYSPHRPEQLQQTSSTTCYTDPSETCGAVMETCARTPAVQAAIRHQMEHERQEDYFPSAPTTTSESFYSATSYLPPGPAPAQRMLVASLPRPPSLPTQSHGQERRRTPALPEIRSPTPIQLPQLGCQQGVCYPAPAPALAPAAMAHQRELRHPPASLTVSQPEISGLHDRPEGAGACGCQTPATGRKLGEGLGEGYPIELLGAYETPVINACGGEQQQRAQLQAQVQLRSQPQYQHQQQQQQQPQYQEQQQQFRFRNQQDQQYAGFQSQQQQQQGSFQSQQQHPQQQQHACGQYHPEPVVQIACPPALPTPVGLHPPQPMHSLPRQGSPDGCACGSYSQDQQQPAALYGPRNTGRGGVYDVLERVLDRR